MAEAARRAAGMSYRGSSNRDPQSIAALVGPRMLTICELEFSYLYLLIPNGVGRMGVLQIHNSVQDPPHGNDSHITPVSPP